MTSINALLEIPLLLVLMFLLHFTPEVRSDSRCSFCSSFPFPPASILALKCVCSSGCEGWWGAHNEVLPLWDLTGSSCCSQHWKGL